tara:strand:- start:198 stop:821 length:624 start_codon:yes stop_codon:yes gene_type:complete
MPDASLSIDGTTVISKTSGNISIDNFNSASGNLTGATFPAGHIIQVKFVEFTGIQTVGDGANNGMTFVNIGTGVSGQEFSIAMSVSSGNKVLGFGNVNLSGNGRYGAIKVFYDSTQIALGDAENDRARVTVSTMRNDNATNDQFIMHNSSFSFNYTPSDTSSHTYSVKAGHTYSNAGKVFINRDNDDGNYSYNHRGYSHFMLMEIAQ